MIDDLVAERPASPDTSSDRPQRARDLRRGKVRDVYPLLDGERLLILTTDRLSAFDRVLTTLPFKGEVLNRISAFWFQKTSEVIDNHVLEVPDPNVTVARLTAPLPLEVVVRGYLSGKSLAGLSRGTGQRLLWPLPARGDAPGPAIPRTADNPLHQG